MAVGPTNSFSRPAMPVPSTARPRRMFFTTWYLQPLRRNSRRSAVSFLTLIPRKSASTRLWALARSSFSAEMFSSLTARSISISSVSSDVASLDLASLDLASLLGLELGDQRQVVHFDAGTHGRGYSHRPHVRPFRRLRLEPQQRLDHRARVVAQLVAAERRLADAGLNDARLLDAELDAARLELADRLGD